MVQAGASAEPRWTSELQLTKIRIQGSIRMGGLAMYISKDSILEFGNGFKASTSCLASTRSDLPGQDSVSVLWLKFLYYAYSTWHQPLKQSVLCPQKAQVYLQGSLTLAPDGETYVHALRAECHTAMKYDHTDLV